jgi:hypothetical protein
MMGCGENSTDGASVDVAVAIGWVNEGTDCSICEESVCWNATI